MKQTKAVEEETINNIILELRNIREFEPYCKGMVDRNHTTRIFKKHLDIAIKSARADEREKAYKEGFKDGLETCKSNQRLDKVMEDVVRKQKLKEADER